ncbi:MAG TPA: acyl-CoA dehydrogenase family protein [Vicinamibacterales bacterium]|nr:acyl-CoA dehydrogenase family protein [Vicinamibacterales bacterium]
MILELTDDQKAFQQQIAAFATEHVAPRAAGIDEDGQFPRDLVQAVARQGLMGVTVGKSWGGGGLDYVSYALAIEELARASAVVSVIVSVNNSLVSEPLEKFGSDAQKDAWLRRLVSGEALGAFALSEEQAGSDAANQQTVARLDNEGYVLNGRKVWVANAEAADIAIVFATTQPTPGSGQNIGGRSISAFLVPLDSAGITRVVTADSLGVRGLGCMDLEFKDVRIGAEALLGGPGEGFHIAMWALDGGRVAIAAQALGVGAAAMKEALDYAKEHVAFGQPIANYQAIQWMLADVATDLEGARMLTMKAADARQRQVRPTADASMAKLFASEAAHRAADRAMQILASKGYRRGSVVERLFRDVRATEIYQGTSEVQRMVIAEHILA